VSRRRRNNRSEGVCVTGIAESKRAIDRIRELDAARRREATQGMLEDRERARTSRPISPPKVQNAAVTVDKTSARELRLLKELVASGLHGFVDLERLAQSQIFVRHLSFVRVRVVEQHDVSDAKALASVFEASKKYHAILM